MRKFVVIGTLIMVALFGVTWFLWQDNIQLQQNNAMLEARIEQLELAKERNSSSESVQSARPSDSISTEPSSPAINNQQVAAQPAPSAAISSDYSQSAVDDSQALDREYADALLGDQTRWNEFVSGSIEQALRSSEVEASPEVISRVTQALSQMRDASIQLSSQEYNIDSAEYQRLQLEKTLLILNVDQMIRNELNMTTADLMDSLDQGEVDDVGADGP